MQVETLLYQLVDKLTRVIQFVEEYRYLKISSFRITERSRFVLIKISKTFSTIKVSTSSESAMYSRFFTPSIHPEQLHWRRRRRRRVRKS
jgi:hypothetical protein